LELYISERSFTAPCRTPSPLFFVVFLAITYSKLTVLIRRRLGKIQACVILPVFSRFAIKNSPSTDPKPRQPLFSLISA
jgi:hypothetical protein